MAARRLRIPTLEQAMDSAIEDAVAARARIRAALARENRVAGRNTRALAADIRDYRRTDQRTIFRHAARAASYRRRAELSAQRLEEADYAIRRLREDRRTAGSDPAVRERVRLYRWVIHGAEDYLCLQYRGTVWEEGTGPMPEKSTHPNCRCERAPIRVRKAQVNDR